jgi:2,4-dienoyl-CoA reductase-like NADH-dependent reductase (Old Yellow Enzyme family)
MIPWGPGFLAPIAGQIKQAVELPVAVGWMITEPKQAEEVLQSQQADVVLLGRELLRDPYWPYRAAQQLQAQQASSILPVQYARAVS